MIDFYCTQCGRPIQVAEQFAGRSVRCPRCGRDMVAPFVLNANGAAPAKPVMAPTPPPAFKPRPFVPRRSLRLRAFMTILVVALIIAVIKVFMAVAVVQNTMMVPSAQVATPAPYTSAPQFPDLPSPIHLANQVNLYLLDFTGTGAGLPMHARLYLPAGYHSDSSLPCVFIAPAGTRLIYGAALGNDDSPEHLPYVHAGFAVMAYELSGSFNQPQNASVKYRDLRNPIYQFMSADGGLANARLAMNYVLSKVPQVDPNRLYAAGHSSAGTMALNLAVADSRIRAVAAYAPATDVVGYWGKHLDDLNRAVPGSAALAARVSPIQHVAQLNCPVFIFHADDDRTVPMADVQRFVDAMDSAGKSVEFRRVPAGGHYDSMIREGIPDGIPFFLQNGAMEPTSSR